jgi:hypothetical protein
VGAAGGALTSGRFAFGGTHHVHGVPIISILSENAQSPTPPRREAFRIGEERMKMMETR